MADDELLALRARIDEIDAALLALVADRRRVASALAEAKAARAIPALDPAREAALDAAWRARAVALGVPEELASALLARILDDSRGLVERAWRRARGEAT